MYNFKKIFILTIFLLTTFFIYSENLLEHSDKVNDIKIINNNIYSISSDGQLKIWNIKKNTLLKSYQVTSLNLTKIAVNKNSNKIALIETDNIGQYNIILWDKFKNSIFKRIKLDFIPLSIKFTHNGSMIVISNLEYNSLLFIKSSNGSKVPLFRKGPSIINNFYLNQKGENIVAYSQSGNIYYLDLKNSKIIYNIPTLPEIKKSLFLTGGKYMVAYKDNYMMLINLKSGKIVRRFKALNIIDMDIKDKNVVYCSKNENFSEIGFWDIKKYKEGSIIYRTDDYSISSISKSESSIIFGCKDGSILKIENRKLNKISAKKALPIESAIKNSENIILNTKNSIFIIDNKNDSESYKLFKNPIQKSCNMFYLNNQILLSEKANNNSTIAVLDINTGKIIKQNTIESGIKSIIHKTKDSEDYIVLLNNNRLTKLNMNSLKLNESINFRGIIGATKCPNNSILAYTINSINSQEPILNINLNTGESYPIKFESSIILDIKSTENKIYISYIKTINEKSYTLIDTFKSENLKTGFTVYKKQGEILSVKMINVDEEIFATLENGNLYKLKLNRFTEMSHPNSVIKELSSFEKYILSINKDNTVTIWNSKNGRIEKNFFIDKKSKKIFDR